MKKVLTNLLLGALLLSTGVAMAGAGSENDGHSGSELVSEATGVKESFVKDRKISLRYTDGAQSGGWWTRGKLKNNLISEYKHYKKKGRASCRNGNGTYSDGGWKSKGKWSKSKVGYTYLGGNKVYYDFK